jgi:cell division protein FtsL
VGAAARKIAHTHTAAPVRPALRLVRGGRRRTAARSAAAASHVFRVAVVCLTVIICAGVLRVSLAASAAEASIDAWELQKQVKAERLVTRSLEADRSALAAPSRIEAVASQSLNMMRPVTVAYLELPSATSAADAAAEVTLAANMQDEPASDGPGVLDTLMDLAAGEAQVMLVGDVGLGSIR